MIINFIENDILVSDVKCLNLDLTLDCGQAFRWVKQDDGSWSGVAGGYFLNIREKDGIFILKDTSKEAFYSFWCKYFDFEKDYDKICEKLKEDELLKSTIDEYYGIRILNQDSFEALFSFVISQQNNIKRIKGIINRLSVEYGKKIVDDFYSFPSAQVLAELSIKDFENLGLGYRAKYLERLAKDIKNKKIDLEKIKRMSLDDAKAELLTIFGVGEKVASCALLFGFQFYEAFPVDVWMKRAMQYYPDGLPKCFDGYQGIAQQYLFHWARNNL